MTRLSDTMRYARLLIDGMVKGDWRDLPDLHDAGTDRLLSDLEQPSILAESERLTGELFPDRAARLAAERTARACEDDAEDPEPFDEFTGPMIGGGR